MPVGLTCEVCERPFGFFESSASKYVPDASKAVVYQRDGGYCVE